MSHSSCSIQHTPSHTLPFLGIDLGGTDCKVGLVTRQGKVVRKYRFPTMAETGPDGVVANIVAQVREFLGSEVIGGCGMGTPGPMSHRLGVIFETPNLPGFSNYPLREKMAAGLGVPVVLHNDANAAAYGEFWVGGGAGDATRDMVMFTLGTGVGGAIILGGQLLLGPDDTAGHLGHMIINWDGERQGNINQGCVEAYASATAVKRQVREAIAAGKNLGISAERLDADDFGSKDVFDAAEAGNAQARAVFEQVGFALGVAAANVINVLNPDLILYGGGMAEAGEYLFGPLRETAQAKSFAKPFSRVRIEAAKLGNDAGLIGAAGLAMAEAEKPATR